MIIDLDGLGGKRELRDQSSHYLVVSPSVKLLGIVGFPENLMGSLPYVVRRTKTEMRRSSR